MPGAVALSGDFRALSRPSLSHRGDAKGSRRMKKRPDMARGHITGAWGRLSTSRHRPAELRPRRRTTTPRGPCGVGSPAPGAVSPCHVPGPRREGGSVPRAGVGAGARRIRFGDGIGRAPLNQSLKEEAGEG